MAVYLTINTKQVFYAFLFNIRIYSHEGSSNIQRREVKLIVILPRVNNVKIGQKMTWNLCFIIFSQHNKVKVGKYQKDNKFYWQQNHIWLQQNSTTSQPFSAADLGFNFRECAKWNLGFGKHSEHPKFTGIKLENS